MVDQNIDEQAREAIELLFYGYRAFTGKADRILEKRGLNRAHHRILYFVGKSPGLSVNDLLASLGISKQSLNVPLRQLVSMGLVENRQASHDRRVKSLRLSASGKRLEHRLTGTQKALFDDVFETAGADAEDAWRQVMRAIADYVDE